VGALSSFERFAAHLLRVGGQQLRNCRGGRKRSALALIALAAYLPVACSQQAPVTEYDVKAAFLYNFGKFIEWPGDAFASTDAPFRLCIAGGEAFLRARESLAGKRIRGRELDLRQVETLAEAEQCHMLFVSAAGDRSATGHPLADVNRAHTLTVGESSDFIFRGGIINLTRVDNRVRFEIDRLAGERAGFRFSAQLLKLATLVDQSH